MKKARAADGPSGATLAEKPARRRALGRLRERRIELEMTLDELARQVGSHKSHLSRLERRLVAPEPWLESALAEALGDPVEDLFEDEPRRGRPKGRSASETAARRALAADLYRAGKSISAIASELTVSRSCVAKDLELAQVEARPPGGRPKHEQPEPRACGLGSACLHAEGGYGRTFTPAPAQAARGFGLFCSAECFHESRRRHPRLEPRACEHCGKSFRPQHPSDASDGRGRFCSQLCWVAYRWSHGIEGGLVPFIVGSCELGGAWKHDTCVERFHLWTDDASRDKRRQMRGQLSGQLPPRQGRARRGAPTKELTAAQTEAVLDRLRKGWGIRKTAEHVGVNWRKVEELKATIAA